MSDLANPLNVFDFLKISPRQVFDAVIADSFFADYGIVTAVHNQTTVDVQHAVLSVTRPGLTAPARVLDALVTTGVEILWMSMGGLAITGTVKTGDVVLLIGLRDLLPSTQGVTAPAQPPEFWHYSQQTLKAIPLSGVTKVDVQFGEKNGLAFLRNSNASLFTVLNNALSAIKTFGATTIPPASGGDSGASASVAVNDVSAAMATLASSLTSVITALGQILEA